MTKVGVASGPEGGHDGWAMRKRRVYVVLLAAGVLVVVGLLVCGVFREREPEYGGKRLSEWVEVYVIPERSVPPVRVEEIDDAIRHVGTNALPYLLRWMRYEPPLLRIYADLSERSC